jgi:hypothetical protein
MMLAQAARPCGTFGFFVLDRHCVRNSRAVDLSSWFDVGYHEKGEVTLTAPCQWAALTADPCDFRSPAVYTFDENTITLTAMFEGAPTEAVCSEVLEMYKDIVYRTRFPGH